MMLCSNYLKMGFPLKNLMYQYSVLNDNGSDKGS